MDLAKLKNYHNWIHEKPNALIESVINAGGWENVFPFNQKIKKWAHRVRNYFNVIPKSLTRLDKEEAGKHLRRFKATAAGRIKLRFTLATGAEYLPRAYPVDPTGLTDIAAEAFALSGDVYEDEFRRPWFQMGAGGTIYHFGRPPKVPIAEAMWQAVKGGQKSVPVFKLLSPDDTGGSRECIINSKKVQPGVTVATPLKMVRDGMELVFGQGTGRTTIGEVFESQIGTVNKKEDVADRIVTDSRYQGSYNYSETVLTGLAAHNWRDVKPHEWLPNSYVDPRPETPIALRRLPEIDLQMKPLAEQDW
jgi:hypothetical protein